MERANPGKWRETDIAHFLARHVPIGKPLKTIYKAC
jgi:hypothetical protein